MTRPATSPTGQTTARRPDVTDLQTPPHPCRCALCLALLAAAAGAVARDHDRRSTLRVVDGRRP